MFRGGVRVRARSAVIAWSTRAGVLVITRMTAVPSGSHLAKKRWRVTAGTQRHQQLVLGHQRPEVGHQRPRVLRLDRDGEHVGPGHRLFVGDDPDAVTGRPVPSPQDRPRRSVATRRSAGQPERSRPEIRVSPMVPAPMTAMVCTICPLRRVCPAGHRIAGAPPRRDQLAEEDLGLGVTLQRHRLQLAGSSISGTRDDVGAAQRRSSCPSSPSFTASMACSPNRVASTRSNAVGVPPRWMWPSTTVRASLPVLRLELLGQPLADATQPDVAEGVEFPVVR